MNGNLYRLGILLLASGAVLAGEPFAPRTPHLNTFIKNPADAAYLVDNIGETLPLTMGQRHNFLSAIALRLGVPDDPPRLLLPPPMRLKWILASMPITEIALVPEPVQAAQPVEQEVIETLWKDNQLSIVIHPNELAYDVLLQRALDALERANDGRLPVVNGRLLKAALEQRKGKPVAIYKRPLSGSKAVRVP